MTYTITEITQGIRNAERVNIFVNNVFWLAMSKNDLIANKLFKGQILTEEEKKEIEEKSTDQKLLDRALLYLQLRPRSISEMRDYFIYKRKLSVEESEEILQKLIEKGLLSDEKFAEWYVTYKLSSGNNGINKIKTELLQKRVDRQIIAKILDSLQQNEEFKDDQLLKVSELAKKLMPTIKAKNSYDLRTKLIQRLLARGYKYDDIKKALASE